MAERGYLKEHFELRAKVAKLVESGRAQCARCGGWILSTGPWDLDHRDDRRGWLGPSHRACNRSSKSRRRSRQW
jgi:hypothetical protein